MENRLNVASYQSSSLLFALILRLSLGVGVLAICAAGFSFTTFFLAVTLLTPPTSLPYLSHAGNRLASVRGAHLGAVSQHVAGIVVLGDRQTLE